jgi:hypothetical protein
MTEEHDQFIGAPVKAVLGNKKQGGGWSSRLPAVSSSSSSAFLRSTDQQEV